MAPKQPVYQSALPGWLWLFCLLTNKFRIHASKCVSITYTQDRFCENAHLTAFFNVKGYGTACWDLLLASKLCFRNPEKEHGVNLHGHENPC